jgi:hypothetical protein
VSLKEIDLVQIFLQKLGLYVLESECAGEVVATLSTGTEFQKWAPQLRRICEEAIVVNIFSFASTAFMIISLMIPYIRCR